MKESRNDSLFGIPSLFGGEPIDWRKYFNMPVTLDSIIETKKLPIKFFDNALTHRFVDMGDIYKLNVSLPIIGDSLTVSVEDNMVTISYSEKNDSSTYRGSYQFSLPDDANPDTVEAELGVVDDNTITVTVKKTIKPSTSRKLNVVH